MSERAAVLLVGNLSEALRLRSIWTADSEPYFLCPSQYGHRDGGVQLFPERARYLMDYAKEHGLLLLGIVTIAENGDYREYLNEDIALRVDRDFSRNRLVREKHGPKLGGMNRTEMSRSYLFSGLMECGSCGKNITMVSGKAPHGRYGCPSHRFRGVCKNAVTIPQRKLEQQLIAAISANLADPQFEQERVSATINHVRLIQEQDAALVLHAETNQQNLEEERAKLKKQIANLVSAIADYGMSLNLRSQLATDETRLKEVEQLLSAKSQVVRTEFSEAEIREFVIQKSAEFADILVGDKARVRQELQKRITKLVLTPREQQTDGYLRLRAMSLC